MAQSLATVVVDPTENHTHTVVFLHGRGDYAHRFRQFLHHSRTSNGQRLDEIFPSFRWVFPQAPVRKLASATVEWPQWFDVWDVRNFSDHEMLQAEGLKEMVPAIKDILASEAALLGQQWNHVILMGISQGAATSVHTLINLDIAPQHGGRLGAFLGFSCRAPFPGKTLDQMRAILDVKDAPNHDYVLRNTPMLLEHCVDDPLVLVEHGRQLRDLLVGYGASVAWREYPTGGHWFNSPAGMDDVKEFLHYHIANGFPNASEKPTQHAMHPENS